MSVLHNEAQIFNGVYEVLNKIGEGGYGNVHLVMNRNDKKRYLFRVFNFEFNFVSQIKSQKLCVEDDNGFFFR